MKIGRVIYGEETKDTLELDEKDLDALAEKVKEKIHPRHPNCAMCWRLPEESFCAHHIKLVWSWKIPTGSIVCCICEPTDACTGRFAKKEEPAQPPQPMTEFQKTAEDIRRNIERKYGDTPPDSLRCYWCKRVIKSPEIAFSDGEGMLVSCFACYKLRIGATTEHKPCPWCGRTREQSLVESYGSWWVDCICHATGPVAHSPEDAWAKWNTR